MANFIPDLVPSFRLTRSRPSSTHLIMTVCIDSKTTKDFLYLREGSNLEKKSYKYYTAYYRQLPFVMLLLWKPCDCRPVYCISKIIFLFLWSATHFPRTELHRSVGCLSCSLSHFSGILLQTIKAWCDPSEVRTKQFMQIWRRLRAFQLFYIFVDIL